MFEELLPNQCVLLVCQGDAQLPLQMFSLSVSGYYDDEKNDERHQFVSELACFVSRHTWVWILVLVHIAFITWGKLFKHKASIARRSFMSGIQTLHRYSVRVNALFSLFHNAMHMLLEAHAVSHTIVYLETGCAIENPPETHFFWEPPLSSCTPRAEGCT